MRLVVVICVFNHIILIFSDNRTEHLAYLADMFGFKKLVDHLWQTAHNDVPVK